MLYIVYLHFARDLLQHEIELSMISLSGVDCAGIVAKCLFILHDYDN